MVPIAMILAAGIGSRLQPLTDRKPKALLDYRGKPMLDHVVLQLIKHGVRELVINVHHHADQIIQYVKSQNEFGLKIHFSDERDKLMDTGGAIVKARPFLEGHGSFLVHNVDIYSDLDLTALYRYHSEAGALATLAVRKRKTTRNLLVDAAGGLCGWRNNLDGETIIVGTKTFREGVEEQTLLSEDSANGLPDNGFIPVAFSGIQVIDPAIFQYLDNRKPFSIIRAFLELTGSQKIIVYDHSSDIWIDMAHRDHFSGSPF